MPLPQNERTFGDRLARGRAMQEKLALFNPAFAPDDSSLTAANFATFLDSVETKNNLVAAAEAADAQSVIRVCLVFAAHTSGGEYLADSSFVRCPRGSYCGGVCLPA